MLLGKFCAKLCFDKVARYGSVKYTQIILWSVRRCFLLQSKQILDQKAKQSHNSTSKFDAFLKKLLIWKVQKQKMFRIPYSKLTISEVLFLFLAKEKLCMEWHKWCLQ